MHGLLYQMKVFTVDLAGQISCNSFTTVTAMFTSQKGKGHGWQDSKLIVERQVNGEWETLTHLSLRGAAGEPKIDIDPLRVDFGIVGLGETSAARFVISNSGDALLNFEIDSNWDSKDIISLDPETPLVQSIPAGQSRVILAYLTSYSAGYCSTTIQVQSSVGSISVYLSGECFLSLT